MRVEVFRVPGVVVNWNERIKVRELRFSERVISEEGVKVIELLEILRTLTERGSFESDVIERSIVCDWVESSINGDPVRLTCIGFKLKVSWVYCVLKQVFDTRLKLVASFSQSILQLVPLFMRALDNPIWTTPGRLRLSLVENLILLQICGLIISNLIERRIYEEELWRG